MKTHVQSIIRYTGIQRPMFLKLMVIRKRPRWSTEIFFSLVDGTVREVATAEDVLQGYHCRLWRGFIKRVDGAKYIKKVMGVIPYDFHGADFHGAFFGFKKYVLLNIVYRNIYTI